MKPIVVVTKFFKLYNVNFSMTNNQINFDDKVTFNKLSAFFKSKSFYYFIFFVIIFIYMCVRVCMCVCMCVCAHARVCVCKNCKTEKF